MEFLQVLRRLFFYSGYPKVMLSDNRWQMVGAERELSLMIEGWDKTKLSEYCAARGMKWQFTTPLAPHQKGCCEVLVKSTKSTLKKALGKAVRTPFEPYTCLFEVVNLLNERPIGRIPNDPDDGACLCPNDIMVEQPTEFLRVHFATWKIHTIGLSSVKRLSSPFGRGGTEMFFLSSCHERNGAHKAEM